MSEQSEANTYTSELIMLQGLMKIIGTLRQTQEEGNPMRSTGYDSRPERTFVVTTEVSDKDLVMMTDHQEIIAQVRYMIAAEITAKIMQRLAPVIDEVLGKYEKETP